MYKHTGLRQKIVLIRSSVNLDMIATMDMLELSESKCSRHGDLVSRVKTQTARICL